MITPQPNPEEFYYTVSENQIAEHRKRSVKEILQWMEEMNKLIFSLKTSEELALLYKFKRKKWGTNNPKL